MARGHTELCSMMPAASTAHTVITADMCSVCTCVQVVEYAPESSQHTLALSTHWLSAHTGSHHTHSDENH